MKKKIVWITPLCFYDVDWPIIGRLKEIYNIRWYVLIGKSFEGTLPQNNDIYRIIHLPYRSRDIRIIPTFIRLIREFKRFNPSILYNAFIGTPYYLPLLFLLFGKKNVIFEGHEINPNISVNNDIISKAFCRFNIKNIGHTQVFSKHSVDEFHRLYPSKQCTYVPMVPKDFGLPQSLINHEGKIVFLFFGGVRSTKRFDILLDAFLSMDENHSKRAELWVYGKSGGKEKEEYLSKAKGHDNIVMKLDFVPDEMVPSLFLSSNYLVLPYERITQSGPMMIAYNYNLPMIATDISGFTERISDGYNGFIFKKNDVADLTRVLEHCIDLDEDNYSVIKKNTKEFAEKEYSIDVVIEKYRAMLDKFIAENE